MSGSQGLAQISYCPDGEDSGPHEQAHPKEIGAVQIRED